MSCTRSSRAVCSLTETRPRRTKTRRFVIVYFQRSVSRKPQTIVTTAAIATRIRVIVAESPAQRQTIRTTRVISRPGMTIAIRPRQDGRPLQISRSSSAAMAGRYPVAGCAVGPGSGNRTGRSLLAAFLGPAGAVTVSARTTNPLSTLTEDSRDDNDLHPQRRGGCRRRRPP